MIELKPALIFPCKNALKAQRIEKYDKRDINSIFLVENHY